MTVFGKYAAYYDLLYRDKDNAAEIAYVCGLIRKYAPKAETVLDMGCGTGRHAFGLAEKGYRVTGIDCSAEMLKAACAKLEEKSGGPKPVFKQADVRTARLGRKFDAAVSLFHVASYQTVNEDLKGFFRTAARHLKKSGLFIFDGWYGPAVLTHQPEPREKEAADCRVKIRRSAVSIMHPNENLVDVQYRLTVSGRKTISETHRMRYLFQPEIEYFLKEAGFRLFYSEEWLTGRKLSFDTWSACWIAGKK